MTLVLDPAYGPGLRVLRMYRHDNDEFTPGQRASAGQGQRRDTWQADADEVPESSPYSDSLTA